MAFDLFDMSGSWLDLLLARRLVIPLVVGVAVAVGFYYLSGETPASAAVAFGIGFISLCAGVIWHIAGGSKPGAA